MKKLIIFKIKMVNTSLEIKNKPHELEITGYWTRPIGGELEEKFFFDTNTNKRIQFMSIGSLGTPEIIDQKTGIITQSYYHITSEGYVIRTTNRYRKNRKIISSTFEIIGLNGKIKNPENPDPNDPNNDQNEVKLIYEPPSKPINL